MNAAYIILRKIWQGRFRILRRVGRVLLRMSRILGVRTRVHYSWYAAFALLTVLVVMQFPDTYFLWQRVAYGIIGSLVPFIAVAARQFLLGILALSLDIPVRNVTLFVFGGISPVPEKDTRPGFELLLAIAGILVNFIIGGAFYWAYLHLAYPDNPLITGLVQWLIFIWVTIIVLHFVPGYPLDGGRLVSAIIWEASRRYRRSIRIMTSTGMVAGWLLAAGGIWLLAKSDQWITGLLPTFLGWVLLLASRSSGRRVAMLQALQPIRANQIMTEEFPVIPPDLNMHQIIRRYALVTGQSFFMVAEEGKLLGTLTFRRIKKIRRRRWRSIQAYKVMTPVKKGRTAAGDDSVASILEQMEQSGTSEMPVVTDGKLLGAVTRQSLVRLARARRVEF